MKVYVMRHGQTAWNAKGRIQGWSESRLTDLGKAQAQDAADKLKNVKIDLIFSSPLMRTMQTANVVNQFHGVNIVKDKRIIEKNAGIFSGKLESELDEKELKLFKFGSKECGVENRLDIYRRVNDFVKFLKTNYAEKNILIVTHYCVVKMLVYCSENENWDESVYEKIKAFGNAEVKQIVL